MPDYIDITIDESPIYIEIASSSDVYVDISMNEPTIPSNYVTLAGVQVLTNKSIVSRVLVLTTGATIDVNADNYDKVDVTALASGTTFSNPTGTPNDFQELEYRILSDATPRNLIFDTDFNFSSDLAAPANTTASKTLILKFQWDKVATKWNCILILDNL